MPDSSRIAQPLRTQPIRPRYKIIAYIVTWLVALFATNPNGKYWPLVYMFPLGLAAFVNQHSGGWGLFAACIGIYLAQAYFYFRSRKVWSTLLLFGVVIALLICNVSGCRAMLNTH